MFAEEGRAHAVTLLTRLARRRKESKPLLDAMLTGRLDDLIDPALEVATETGQPLGTALAECFEREGSEELAEWLAYRLSEDPYTSVWPLHAVTREAAGIYHHLAASSPQIFTEDLASCLNSLSHHLYEAGQVKESVAAGRKVIKLYRQILACTSEAAAGLAAALSNLAPRLCELGQPAQALRYSKEAVKIYRRKGDDPEGLATALHSAAASLLDLDRPREALPCLQEAVEIRSNLAADRSRNSEVDLAASMVALGRCFNDQGRCQEAVAETRRGIRLLRRAVTREGDFLRPRLAMALSNQAHQLRELGEQQAAFKSAQEAISLLAPFFIEQPAHFWNGPRWPWDSTCKRPRGRGRSRTWN